MKFKRYFLRYSLVIVLIIMIAVFSLINPLFIGKTNVSNFMRQIPVIGILTVGITMVLISGGVDLSIGSITAFSGIAAVYMAVKGIHPIIVVLLALATGAFWGLVNGTLITRFDLEPFISTLGVNLVARGLILFLTDGINIKGLPDWFYKISNTNAFNNLIYTNTIIFAIIVIVMAYIMNNTRFGKYCYAVGANKEVARLSGINVKEQVIKVYVIEAMLASIAGILLMSNLNVGAPREAEGIDLFALAAAIIGGTQFGGGVGTIYGSIIGIFTIEIFKNGLAMLGMNTYMQQLVTGLIILVAVVVDYYRKQNPSIVAKNN